MNRIVVSLEFDDVFDDMYGGTCRVLDLTRKMAFELERCVVNVVQAGTGRMHLRLADRLDDPTRRQALVHRLASIPTVRVVTAEEVRTSCATAERIAVGDGGPSRRRGAPMATQSRAHVEIDSEECKGCGLCVTACPPDCLELDTQLNGYGVHPARGKGDGCTGCGICFYCCPEPGAITVFHAAAKPEAAADRVPEAGHAASL